MVTFPDCSVRHTVANTAPVGGNENTASGLVGVSLPACLPASQPAASVRATNEACGLYWHAFIRSLLELVHRVPATFLVYRSRNQVSQTFDRPYSHLLISGREPLPHILTVS